MFVWLVVPAFFSFLLSLLGFVTLTDGSRDPMPTD